MRAPPLRFLALLACFLVGCTSPFDKDPEVLIAVFSEGTDMDSPKTVFRKTVEGRPVILKVIPEFTHKSIVAFHPFPAEDGTFGITLQLDFKGRNALEIVTRTQQGGILVSLVNNAIVDWATIDQQIDDGLFTIWRGLPEELIKVLDETYPRIQALKEAKADSSSEMLEMVPSTGKEKKNAFDRVKKAKKEEEEAAKRKARGEEDPAPEPPKGGVVPLSEALKSAD